jgi:FkbM family methyltransferase
VEIVRIHAFSDTGIMSEHADLSHSYQGQDLFVLEMLGELHGGYFLDSGASNGLRGSNTRMLEHTFGWRGICIEPNTALFEELVRNRGCVCLSCCLYDREGSVDFLEAAGVYGGIVQEYAPSVWHLAQRLLIQRASGGTPPVTRKPARTLRSILKEAGAPPVIDYWSLDTEGSELAILKSFPFDDYCFRVLTVEHNNEPVREDIRAFLQARGYTFVRSLGIDDGYVWKQAPHGSAWRSAAFGRSRQSGM